jgi:hypothetical protein
MCGLCQYKHPQEQSTMITPRIRDGLVWWMSTEFAMHYEEFLSWGDHGWFCEIKFETV